MVREIKKKKTSNLEKNGRVVWQMCEVTISVYPAAYPKLTDTVSIPAVANPSRSAGTNKKQRLLGNSVKDQSTSLTLSTDENEVILLDKKT